MISDKKIKLFDTKLQFEENAFFAIMNSIEVDEFEPNDDEELDENEFELESN